MNPETQAAIAAAQQGPQNLQEYYDFISQVLVDGGWVMIPLFLLTIFIYFEAVSLMLRLNRTGVRKVSYDVWSNWLRNPQEGKGHIGEVIRFITADGFDHERLTNRLSAVRLRILPSVNQRITTLSVLVTISPLMGLLGTVIGMLTTFKGLATSAGQTVDLVAEGISVALITTQTGLMIAIPGYIFISQVIKKRNEYNAFMAQLESLAMQECNQSSKNDSATTA